LDFLEAEKKILQKTPFFEVFFDMEEKVPPKLPAPMFIAMLEDLHVSELFDHKELKKT